MQIEFIREAGRAIRFFIPSNIDATNPDERDFRAFAEEHEDSALVLIKCGYWPDSAGRSCDLYTLRRKFQPQPADLPVTDEHFIPGVDTPKVPKARRTFVERIRIVTGFSFLIVGAALGISALHFTALDLKATAMLTASVAWWIGIESLYRGTRRG